MIKIQYTYRERYLYKVQYTYLNPLTSKSTLSTSSAPCKSSTSSPLRLVFLKLYNPTSTMVIAPVIASDTRIVILAGSYPGASRAWNVWGPQIYGMYVRQILTDARISNSLTLLIPNAIITIAL